MIPYIRVKRKSQTVFLDVQFSDTFASVKEKLGALFHVPPQHIQLWLGLNQVRLKCDLLSVAFSTTVCMATVY